MLNHIRILLCLLSLLSSMTIGVTAHAGPPRGGGACVVAKKDGSALDIVWVTGKSHPYLALEAAERQLHEKGYKVVFPQETSNLAHGFLVVVRADYTSRRGRARVNYGCGFSRVSWEHAETLAMLNLTGFAWDWKSAYGYRVIERSRF